MMEPSNDQSGSSNPSSSNTAIDNDKNDARVTSNGKASKFSGNQKFHKNGKQQRQSQGNGNYRKTGNNNSFQRGRGNYRPKYFDRQNDHENGNDSCSSSSSYNGNGRGGRGGRRGGSLSSSQTFPSTSSLASITSSMSGVSRLSERAPINELTKSFQILSHAIPTSTSVLEAVESTSASNTSAVPGFEQEQDTMEVPLLIDLSQDGEMGSSVNQFSQNIGNLSVTDSTASHGSTDVSTICPDNISCSSVEGAEDGIPIPEAAAPQSIKQSLANLVAQHIEKNAKTIALLEKREEQLNSKKNAPRGVFNLGQVSQEIMDRKNQLPIYTKKKELIELVKTNKFVIVIGETGSGKSTQIPQYLAEAGIHGRGKIGVTQPRRVAAKSLAERVALECGVEVGSTVGYSVRFDHKSSADTVIKYMTDGVLVKECSTERSLNGYTVIIIDEAHERSIDTDICFGLLKAAATKRKDLKVIISSATLEDEKFSEYFDNAPVFHVTGKGYEVEVVYEPKTIDNYIQGAVDIIGRINKKDSSGDILVFLPGQDDIEKVAVMIRERQDISGSLADDIVVTRCYGSLPLDLQGKIFQQTNKNQRKVVLATNIAETSITIDGIVYVIDCGYFKQKCYNAKSGIYTLSLERITKFQAIQRAGRAGRTQPGKCYRLYTEQEFNESMKESTTPEITRSNVESVMLNIIAMGISNPLNFDFMDQPPIDSILHAMEHLIELSALDGKTVITELGRQMAALPLDPPLAKVVIESTKLGCTSEILKIVSLLSIQCQNLFSPGQRDRKDADKFRKAYDSPDGDMITFLNVYDAWLEHNNSEDWCKSQNIHYGYMVEAEEIRFQLVDVLKKMGIGHRVQAHPTDAEKLSENIRKAFTAGYFRHLAQLEPVGNYTYHMRADVTSVDDVDVDLHPSSSLFKMARHPWVIYHEVMLTKKVYMKGVIPIDPKWIFEYAPVFADKVKRFLVPTDVQ